MSYVIDQSGQPAPRPGVVTTARALLYVAAAVSLGYGAISAFANATAQPVAPPPNASPEFTSSTTLVVVILSVTLYVLLAVGFGVLGALVGKGKNPARIVTWVVGGIVALCCGCSSVSNALLPSIVGSIDDPQAQEAFDEILSSTPTWVSVTSLMLSILLVVILVVVIILLMVPAANTYFRRETEVWVPPTWPAGTPAYPAPPPVISESAFPPAPPIEFPPSVPTPPAPPPAPPTTPPSAAPDASQPVAPPDAGPEPGPTSGPPSDGTHQPPPPA